MNIDKCISIALGLESEYNENITQPISQITGEVITGSVDEFALESRDVVSEINELQSKVESLAESKASLESYISFMEQQLAFGGMNKHIAQSVNIGLESIANRYGIPSHMLNVSLEDVTDDQIGETKKTTGRAKELLGKITGGARKLVMAIVTKSIQLFKSIEKLHTSIIHEARQLKNNIVENNAGGQSIGHFAFSKYIFNTSGDTDGNKYVSALVANNEILKDITNVWDTQKMEMFIADVSANFGDVNAKVDLSKAKDIIDGVKKHTNTVNEDDSIDTSMSDTLLGGAKIVIRSPSLNMLKTIAKEGRTLVPRDAVYLKETRPDLTRTVVLAVASAVTGKEIEEDDDEEFVESKGLVQKVYDLMLFTSMKINHDKIKTGNILSLSGAQIAQVCDVIISSSYLNNRYKSYVASKKKLIDSVNKEYVYYYGDDNEHEIASKAAASDILHWFLRTTSAFENEFVTHTVYTMHGALNYAKKSNKATGSL